MGQRGWNLKRPHKIIAVRESHPRWKGDDATTGAKNMRARQWIPLSGMCEKCQVKRACDRHHKDGNPGNNEPSNVALLCRRCHMEVDGRLARLKEMQAKYCVPKPPKPCCNCGQLSKPLRRGRCINCAAFFRRTGNERPIRMEADHG